MRRRRRMKKENQPYKFQDQTMFFLAEENLYEIILGMFVSARLSTGT
jgi:hypothetical protein